jgi:hypothetical protein
MKENFGLEVGTIIDMKGREGKGRLIKYDIVRYVNMT